MLACMASGLACGVVASEPSNPCLGAGPIPIRDTDYPIPKRSWFVSSEGGDSALGEIRTPWKTLARAVASVAAGATIVLRGGTYREGEIEFGAKSLTIQAHPHEAVGIKGSLVVDGWEAVGRTWQSEGWTRRFPRDADPEAIDPAHPLADWPDMVLLDEKPLRQDADESSIGPGAFFVDERHRRLVIGDDLGGRRVEASAYRFALDALSVDRLVIRGLGFSHHATCAWPRYQVAVILTNTRASFEKYTFTWNATGGPAFFGRGAEVRENTFADNGQIGIAGWKCDGSKIEGNKILSNNVEHFRKDWDNGGLKNTEARDISLRNNDVCSNDGLRPEAAPGPGVLSGTGVLARSW
jgi:hypothetical protein